MISKQEELKHSVILLQDATKTLFQKLKHKKFKKRTLVQIESAFMDLIGVITTSTFDDFDEYQLYVKRVKREIHGHIEDMKKKFMA
jgi:hypothetical protein